MARCKSSSKTSSKAIKKMILPMGKMLLKSKIKAHYQVISELSNNRFAGEDNASEIADIVTEVQKLEESYRQKYCPGLVFGDYHPSAFVLPPRFTAMADHPASPKGVSDPDTGLFQSTRL